MKLAAQIVLATVFIAGGFAALPGATAERASQPPAGLLNFSTGEVWINGVEADASSAGQAVLEKDGEIITGNGMAELLLTPGSFLRLGSGSSVTLKSADASNVQLRLIRGRALIEMLVRQPPLHVEQSGVTAAFEKPGLYSFDATHGRIAVYSGEAILTKGKGQLKATQGVAVKTGGFREVQAIFDSVDPILAWSRLRSEQLSSQSAASAQTGKLSPGWGWDPWAHSYTWLSASGAVTGPFGWPYYSPGYTPNAIPSYHGDGYLYGAPLIRQPDIALPARPAMSAPSPTVPLTAPGVPHFPNNKF